MIFTRSILYAIFLSITVIPHGIVCIFLYPFLSKDNYRKLVAIWPRLALWGVRIICNIDYKTKGLDHFPEGPKIILSNHQSAWETLYFLAKFPCKACYVYKKELNWIPFFGWNLFLLRMIPINRLKGRESFKKVIQYGTKKIEEGFWPIIFPEGKRESEEKIGDFKKGAAFLAIETGIPIVPVVHNSGTFWKKKAFSKTPGSITLSIGPIIKSRDMDPETINQEVKTWMKNEMQSIILNK